jgi:hypothetical protein
MNGAGFIRASRLGRPAYEAAPPRVTASMVAKHGSYAAARAALSAPAAASPALPLGPDADSPTSAVEAGAGNGASDHAD